MAEPQLEIQASESIYARVVASPLEKGSGITLGNALRRVLLNSLPGAAVTWMKIEGLHHEFSTIPNVKEDAMEFLLNVKSLRLRSLSQRPGTLSIEVLGSREITAADIRPSADFEVVNPGLHLATLDLDEGRFSAEFNVEIGKGYVPADSGKGLPIGVIPVDAIYTPTKRVNYSVEQIIVAQEGNLEKLILEVWTDGTVSGVEAISQAADILTRQLAMFRDLARASVREGKKSSLRMAVLPEQYDMALEQVGLSTRTLNCLRRGGMSTVGELLERSQDGLPNLPNFGQKSREEVLRALESMGVHIPSGDGEAGPENVEGEVGSQAQPAVTEVEGADETSSR
ncbi:MAG: DNA-directed RNA polymerase subunit alpha [Chloroflexi bacterium]|nr:DNA-directed RNA polymerase subunit alpha [Chloroflexota bacterium]